MKQHVVKTFMRHEEHCLGDRSEKGFHRPSSSYFDFNFWDFPISPERHLKGDKALEMAVRTREENFSLEEKVLLARLVLAKEAILFPPGRGRGSIMARRKAWSDIRCTIYREIGTWREIESIKAKYRALRRQDVTLLAQLRREGQPLLAGGYHPGMHNQLLVRGEQVVLLNDDEELEVQELEEENEEEEEAQETEEDEQLNLAAAPVAVPAGPPPSADPSPPIAESAPPVEPPDQSVSQALLKALQGLTDSNIALMREVTMLRSCMAGLIRVVEGQRPCLIQEIEGMRVELRALTEAIRQQGACGSLPFDSQV
ncbi:uncharacterized protein LOC115465493 [Microcaecilia unicolor]|uniref:Uncharacterized protein LOC115465493 n=1 Tax=Microcaecilia unicolor TaxID=1415580 RepID=A0A6P7XN75_9AMPH|nr:uncharacterized protein LOC115465493 [Microcaecilia unicolor]